MTGELQIEGRVVHPATGEVLDLALTSDQLAQWHYELTELKRAIGEALPRIDAELRTRMGGCELWPVGAFEVSLQNVNESLWDAEQLETVLRELVETGAVQAGNVTEVIRHETTVSRSEAGRLAKQLTGRARDAVEACRTWRRKSGRIVVERSVQLPAGDS